MKIFMRRVCLLCPLFLLFLLTLPDGGAATTQGSDVMPGWKETLSNDGSWRVHWRLLVDQKQVELPIVRRRFTIELKIESTSTPKDFPRAIIVDAQMPEHAHGMNVAPTISLDKNGSGRSDGMLFHMSGRWEVDVDIDDGFTVERAQWNIEMY